MAGSKRRVGAAVYIIIALATLFVLVLCVCVGSVFIPVSDALRAIWEAVFGLAPTNELANSVIISVRLPRVLCVALSGAALSLCGAAMQGLLRNPLADGSTLGVS
ncbi:MAG: iron chelate uptake ABC transporter family permease subunit, partial [Oscillospiraceae bacterium]